MNHENKEINAKRVDLCQYRMRQAEESLIVAEECCNNKHYKDSINRSYYAAFYAVKALLAIKEIDFKRHKDVMAYFNKNYVATGLFPKELGKRLGKAQQKRERSDYDDFYVASEDEAMEQVETARMAIMLIKKYLDV